MKVQEFEQKYKGAWGAYTVDAQSCIVHVKPLGLGLWVSLAEFIETQTVVASTQRCRALEAELKALKGSAVIDGIDASGWRDIALRRKAHLDEIHHAQNDTSANGRHKRIEEFSKYLKKEKTYSPDPDGEGWSLVISGDDARGIQGAEVGEIARAYHHRGSTGRKKELESALRDIQSVIKRVS